MNITTIQEIRSIDSAHLARLAFRANAHLRKEYSSEDLFLAFWAGERLTESV